MLEQNSFLVLL